MLVLPSYEEGFGLPVLEAMACGVPVIVSSRGSLPEVAGAGRRRRSIRTMPTVSLARCGRCSKAMRRGRSSAAWRRPRSTAGRRARRRRGAPINQRSRSASRFPLRRDKSMSVAIDARELCGRPTGVGRYLAGSARRLVDERCGTPPSVDADRAARCSKRSSRWAATVEVAGGSGGTIWEQIDAAARRSRGAGRCVLRAGIHCSIDRGGSPGPHDSRRVVLRAPGMVFVPRGRRAAARSPPGRRAAPARSSPTPNSRRAKSRATSASRTCAVDSAWDRSY